MRQDNGKSSGKRQGLNKKQLLSHQAKAQAGFDVVGAAIFMFEVVGVLPNVDAVNGGAASY